MASGAVANDHYSLITCGRSGQGSSALADLAVPTRYPLEGSSLTACCYLFNLFVI